MTKKNLFNPKKSVKVGKSEKNSQLHMLVDLNYFLGGESFDLEI